MITTPLECKLEALTALLQHVEIGRVSSRSSFAISQPWHATIIRIVVIIGVIVIQNHHHRHRHHSFAPSRGLVLQSFFLEEPLQLIFQKARDAGAVSFLQTGLADTTGDIPILHCWSSVVDPTFFKRNFAQA